MSKPLTYLTALGAAFLLVSGTVLFGAEETIPGPAFKEVLSLKSLGSPSISPDGTSILYTVHQADWDKNRYDTEIWLQREGQEPFQLTRTTDGSSSGPAWSPNGKWISFLSSRDEENQIYLISPWGGEAFPLTDHKEGVSTYRWSPDGTQIVFSAQEPKSKESEVRELQYGRFAEEDSEYRLSHLWIMDVDPDNSSKPRPLTSGKEFTVSSFRWSPDGKQIVFDHRPDPLINSYTLTEISFLDVKTKETTLLVKQPQSASSPRWSPDGRFILFNTKLGDDQYYTNSELAIIPASGGESSVITKAFDENLSPVEWNSQGIFCLASEKVFRRIYLLNPDSGSVKKLDVPLENINGMSFARDGKTLALHGYDRTHLPEIYRSHVDSFKLEPITRMTEQVEAWQTGTREVIAWQSRDETLIEGILWKPEEYVSGKKYPLLVIIHGGPTGTSRPTLVSGGVYPYLQWLEKGALILQPNYRGSAGYGEKFRSLNVGNLGVGDMWDVESGVDHLIEKGMADPDRVGAMGWSQGGYISAFLSTNSQKFKALSVGAGISNWVTYYVNTDIHPFTRHYLKATPWQDMAVYRKTSPMTNINQARTPTLIQHGEFDRRVPIPNAYELYQGLQDVGVETKLIVYKDFGHGISRPKEQLAAQWHNWQWFAKYIWDETVEIPLELDKKK
jgi:dipeptidyl aminopeptidase/acylaminoacyl peptidase